VNFTIATGAGQATASDYTEDLSAGTATINVGQSFVDLTITPVDDALAEGAETVTLSLSPSKTVDLTYDGLTTAPTNAESYTVVGTINDTNYQGTASGTLVIAKATATVTLGSLSATFDNNPHSATATTNPAGKTVNFTYDDLAGAPTNAGNYAVVGTISDANYQGSASGTLVIAKATATVTLGSLSATFDNNPHAATTATNPAGKTVNFTYDGLAGAPTNAGSYAVVGTISDGNYQGTASSTLVIAKAAATVTLGSLSATFDNNPHAATATTIPAGKIVTFTYEGLAGAPTNAGSYAVVGTISDANYQGTASGTLVIAKATSTVTLSGLSQTYDGTQKSATAATANPTGLTVDITYNGSATAPTNAGNYSVVGTINDANHQGSAKRHAGDSQKPPQH